jgi:hypothetical protein
MLSDGPIYQQLSQKIAATPVFFPENTICHPTDRLPDEAKENKAYSSALSA